MSEQVGNAKEAPESINVQDTVMSGMNSDNFFEELDAQVNGAIIEKSEPLIAICVTDGFFFC